MRLSWSFRLVTACLAVMLLPTSSNAPWRAGGQAAAAGAGPVTGTPGNPSAPQGILYNQTDSPGSNVADSSDWGSAFRTLNSQAADDFIVPSNALWGITRVTAGGSYIGFEGNGVLSLLVQFYNNDPTSNLPSSQLLSQTVTVPSANISGLDSGALVVTLTNQLHLGPGHYWFSVQAREDCISASCKHWVWTERSIQSNIASVWQNPRGGISPSCPTWEPRVDVCHDPGPGSSGGKDLLFMLEGTTTPVVARLLLPIVRR